MHGGDGARGEETSEGSDEIHELRKLIVGMMQTEMELVERIRQNEESIATVNERIEECKELISGEQRRQDTIRGQMNATKAELDDLESKKTVVETRHRQFVDMVANHSRSICELRLHHECLRGYIANVELHIDRSRASTESLLRLTRQLEEQRSLVICNTIREEEIADQNSTLKMTRMKKRNIEASIGEIENDIRKVESDRQQKEVDLEAAKQEYAELVGTIRAFERDCVRRRRQITEETDTLRLQLEQLTKKLQAKQKKYRTKTKAENGTLKKRITFLTRELELHQMDIEDILSSVAPFRDQNAGLQIRKAALEDEVAKFEAQISLLRDQIEQFDTLDDKCDTSKMKAELTNKNGELEDAAHALTRAKDKLARLQEEYMQIQSEKHNLERAIGNLSLEELKEQLTRESSCLEMLRIEHNDLANKESTIREKNKTLRAQYEEKQMIHKKLKAATLKLQKELRNALKSEEQLTAQLHQEEHTLVLVDQIEQRARQLEEELSAAKQANASKLRALEIDLQEKEAEWKQKCLDQETRLKAELEEWSSKAQSLQDQLRPT